MKREPIRNQLTFRQRRFLRMLDASELPTDEILAQLSVRPAHLAIWLRSKALRKELKNFRRRFAFMTDLDMARVARSASKQLSQIAFGTDKLEGQETRHKICMEVVKYEQEQRRKAKAKAQTPAAPAGKGYHETVGPEEAEELLGRLGADRCLLLHPKGST